jgi:hypothetical protein
LWVTAETVYGLGMPYSLIVLTILIGLGAQSCAPVATDRLPPDSVMNPRGSL